jgi:predicted nucleotidyltransferase
MLGLMSQLSTPSGGLASSLRGGMILEVITRLSINRQREGILEIAARYGATDIRVIGSVARGDATDASDLDLIVRFEPGRSLLDHGGLVMDLRELLGIRVDVIDEEALQPRFRQHVMKEAIPL